MTLTGRLGTHRCHPVPKHRDPSLPLPFSPGGRQDRGRDVYRTGDSDSDRNETYKTLSLTYSSRSSGPRSIRPSKRPHGSDETDTRGTPVDSRSPASGTRGETSLRPSRGRPHETLSSIKEPLGVRGSSSRRKEDPSTETT